MNSHILQGDALERLRELPDESVDTVITDPPYGYSFMGKDWDKAVPSVEIWQECLRVLKPGAFACVMSAPRSDVQNAMISRLMEAGFRLDFTPIYWTYASGFPKAGNVGKLVDKRLGSYVEGKPTANARFHSGGDEGNYNHAKVTREFTAQSDQAKALDGSYTGFQPKPAVEVVIIAMKPLSEKTYVDQALKNGKGITWLDDCRVPTDSTYLEAKGNSKPMDSSSDVFVVPNKFTRAEPNQQGRFPANLLVSDDVLNDGIERKSGKATVGQGGKGASDFMPNSTVYSVYADSGSYSRFFDLDAWARERLPAEQAMTFPFAIFPKASKSEKNKGLDGFAEQTGNRTYGEYKGTPDHSPNTINKTKNHHPTVKPLKLMSYLITLFSREGDTVLDPFVGSGTTVVAAEQLNRVGIGIEREAEYAEIARARLAAEKSTVKQATFL